MTSTAKQLQATILSIVALGKRLADDKVTDALHHQALNDLEVSDEAVRYMLQDAIAIYKAVGFVDTQIVYFVSAESESYIPIDIRYLRKLIEEAEV